MKNTAVLYGVVAAAVVFGFAACDNGTTGNTTPLSGNIRIIPNRSILVGTILDAEYTGDEEVSYRWKREAAAVGSGSTFTPLEAGSYTVTVSAPGFASKTSAPVTVIPLGLIDMEPIYGAQWFDMGSPDGVGNADERPARRVILTCVYVGIYPVTQAQYLLVTGESPSQFAGGDLPVEQVSWYDAVEFCNELSLIEGFAPAYRIDKDNPDPDNLNDNDSLKWTITVSDGADGYRLPTEAEWEYACRAGTTTLYNTGNDTISASEANFGGSLGGTTAAGSYSPNSKGLYDMHGNVWEWCGDWYDENCYANIPGPVGNPQGPAAGENRVIRGGAWDSPAEDIRSASRGSGRPDYAGSNNTGFRVVRPVYPDGWPPP